MSDENTNSEPALEPEEQGGWTEFADLYPSPTALLVQSLRTLRKFPDTIVRPEDLPPDRKEGDPLPLVDELTYLFRDGTIGKIQDDKPIITDKELLAAAPEVWGLDTEGVEKLKTEILPIAEKKGRELVQRRKEEGLQTIEEGNRFFLQTWNLTRLDKLIELLSLVPASSIPTIQGLKDRYNNIQRKTIGITSDELKISLSIEEPEQRRTQVQKLRDRISAIIGQITFLTDHELREMTEHEQFAGYLFLDTLVGIIPTLYQTAAAAKRKELALKTVRFHSAEGEEQALLGQREHTFENLLYGASQNDRVRSLIERTMRKGNKIPGPQAASPPEDK